ncbi:MAG TPA: HAD-IC family P-type ATPase, partial [Novosphingobium sp.]
MTHTGTRRAPAPETERRFWEDTPAGAWPEDRTGLTSAEAARRLAQDGPNLVEADDRTTLVRQLLRKLAEPLVLILIAAAGVSGATGDMASLVIILAIVAISIGLDVYQEHGAQRAAAALRETIALTVRVLRDGAECTVPSHALVRGDVVRLAPGNVVPADGVVLDSHAARADEAILTGEPYPVDKSPVPSHATILAEASDALFAGTALVSGQATMVVRATGRGTCLGRISADLAQDQPLTAFERGLHKLGLLIIRLTLALVLFVLLTQLVFQRPPLESFMFATALAVGLTPELLPMVTTVTLARGAVRMARRRVIVKRLAAIHDLGAMDVLCTDKTGTLTEARIALAATPGPEGADSARVLELAAVNSRFSSGVGTPLDAALLAAAPPTAAQWQRLADLPFDFERRRAGVLAARDGQALLIVKGAPEGVLTLCTQVDGPDGPVPLDAARRAALDALHEARAAAGERLLGVAWRAMPGDAQTVGMADERDLVFAGFCSFRDPPKPSAAAAIL